MMIISPLGKVLSGSTKPASISNPGIKFFKSIPSTKKSTTWKLSIKKTKRKFSPTLKPNSNQSNKANLKEKPTPSPKINPTKNQKGL